MLAHCADARYVARGRRPAGSAGAAHGPQPGQGLFEQRDHRGQVVGAPSSSRRDPTSAPTVALTAPPSHEPPTTPRTGRQPRVCYALARRGDPTGHVRVGHIVPRSAGRLGPSRAAWMVQCAELPPHGARPLSGRPPPARPASPRPSQVSGGEEPDLASAQLERCPALAAGALDRRRLSIVGHRLLRQLRRSAPGRGHWTGPGAVGRRRLRRWTARPSLSPTLRLSGGSRTRASARANCPTASRRSVLLAEIPANLAS